MFFCKTLIFSMLSLFVAVRTLDDELFSNLIDSGVNAMRNFKADLYFMEDKIQALFEPEKVNIDLYYECLCPGCRGFDTEVLKPTVEKLASYLNVKLYPYGNAKTIVHDDGTYDFKCQHGPEECYGNKLHACAIENLKNMTKAVFFNSCMMDSSRKNKGSDDEAADECGKSMNVDTEWIKKCAKGDRGNELLKQYGDASKVVGYKYVPYVLINGVEKHGDNFLKDVCAAFKSPPPECADVLKREQTLV